MNGVADQFPSAQDGMGYPTRETWLAEQRHLAGEARDVARLERLEVLARSGTDEVLERAARQLLDGAVARDQRPGLRAAAVTREPGFTGGTKSGGRVCE